MITPLLCRLLNSEQAMEFGLKMTKLFLVFTLLVTEGLSKPIEQSTQIGQQSFDTYLANFVVLGLERFKTDQSSSKY